MHCVKLSVFFDIDATVSWIKHNNFHRVALQFPDSLLQYSADIASHLECECGTSVKTFILADSTYRSCCVDTLAAEQCCADCIVHYGDSCMSERNARIPIRFVYGSMPVDLGELGKALKQYTDEFENKCCLLYDASYASSSEAMLDLLSSCVGAESVFHCRFVEQFDDSKSGHPFTSGAVCLGRQVPDQKCNVTVVFIGETDSPLLPLWLMTNLNCTSVFTFTPTTLRHSFENHTTRNLCKRMLLIEKLRDARTVGLVINTVDLVGYKEAAERIRKLCKHAGKKCYTLAVGKINVPKLSNFANDIEVFIVLSCPYGIILDVTDFYRPVLSIFEAEVALNPSNKWSAGSGWTAEFKNFLYDEIGENVEIEAGVSLITGKIRCMGTDNDVTSCNALSTYTAGDYFLGRTWKGLDDSFVNKSTAVQRGRSGIASQYKSELFN